jgi:hypothetical protein
MLGFEVSFKDRIIHASIGNEGVLSVIVSYVNKCVDPKCNGTHFSIGGLDDFKYFNRLGEQIDDVERIKIKVIDVKNNSPSINSRPIDRNKMLEDYHKLKNELETEGLL